MHRLGHRQHQGLGRAAFTALTLLAAGAAVACGGAPSTTSNLGTGAQSNAGSTNGAGRGNATASVDACTVLDSATASAALGAPVGAAQRDDGGAKCGYDATDDSGANVTLEMHAVRGNASADDLLSRNAQPVSGLGDKAFWNESLATLVVYKGQGDVVVQVVLAGGNTTGAQDKARSIAAKALSSF